MSDKKPALITDFPGESAERYYRRHGRLPSEEPNTEKADAREDPIRNAAVRPVKWDSGAQLLERSRPFDGNCEGCGKKADLRPYGRGGRWICFACGEKDPVTGNACFGHVVFGDPKKE
jgi:hypothetical protein